MLVELLSRYWWRCCCGGSSPSSSVSWPSVWPGVTLASLVMVFGAYALVDGVFAIVGAIRGGGSEPWWLLVLEGLVGIGIGVLTLFAPGVTALALLFYIAIWAIATASSRSEPRSRCARRSRASGCWRWAAWPGRVRCAAGGAPGEGALAVLWIIGAYALVFGALLVLLSFRARKLRGLAPT